MLSVFEFAALALWHPFLTGIDLSPGAKEPVSDCIIDTNAILGIYR
jgi:hypothetical protein